MGRLIREKQELHTQYAHEIEAAHSQLNEREHQLEAEHVKALQEIKAQQLEGWSGWMIGSWAGQWLMTHISCGIVVHVSVALGWGSRWLWVQQVAPLGWGGGGGGGGGRWWDSRCTRERPQTVMN